MEACCPTLPCHTFRRSRPFGAGHAPPFSSHCTVLETDYTEYVYSLSSPFWEAGSAWALKRVLNPLVNKKVRKMTDCESSGDGLPLFSPFWSSERKLVV